VLPLKNVGVLLFCSAAVLQFNNAAALQHSALNKITVTLQYPTQNNLFTQ
jgi:hypothetical protein